MIENHQRLQANIVLVVVIVVVAFYMYGYIPIIAGCSLYLVNADCCATKAAMGFANSQIAPR